MEKKILFLKSNSSYTIKKRLAETTAHTVILVGSKEQKIMRQSSDALHKAIHNSKLKVLDNYYHGELSFNHPKEYVELLDNLIEG